MAYHYSNANRERDAYTLPDVEIFEATQCEECGVIDPESNLGGDSPYCPHSEMRRGFFYQFGFPGCLPDSDASGPFASEVEALADARQSAGFCPHGVAEDDESGCGPCDAKADETLYVIRGTPRGANNGRFACFATDALHLADKWASAHYAQRALAERGWPTDQWEVVSVAQAKRDRGDV
jgi:hypothetical protein